MPSNLRFEPYDELPMGISKLWAMVQFRLGSHTLPVEQGRFARPAVPRHLCRCAVCDTQAVGDELHCVFDCPQREREIHYVHSASLAYEDGIVFMSEQVQQGNETMADRLLVLVPHEHTHAPRSILEQARKLVPDVTDGNEGNQTHNRAHRPQLVYRKRCTGKGGAGRLAWQNGPVQWAEYGNQV